jgi:hypothetical protein
MKLIAVAFFVCAFAAAGVCDEVLPDSIAGWQAAGDVQVYVGDDLFLYIDGGAEVQHEYGFDRVFVRDYMRGEDIIAVEVYRMTKGAFGLFSFTRSGRDEAVQLGNGGALSDYYLAFWSGNDMVVITAQNGFEGTRAAVLEVGRKLAERFPASGSEPEMVKSLPTEGKVAGSEKYIAGPVVMQNVAYSVSRFVTGYREAATAEYHLASGAEGMLMFVKWSDAEAAAVSVEAAVERAQAAGLHARRVDNGDANIYVKEGEQIEIRLDGNTAWIAVAGADAVAEINGLRTAS